MVMNSYLNSNPVHHEESKKEKVERKTVEEIFHSQIRP